MQRYRFTAVFAAVTLAALAGLLMSETPGTPGRGKPGRSGALEALEFWSAVRAYPAAEIPPDAYARAFRHSRAMEELRPSGETRGAVWSPIGPLDVQGRALCVAVNPLNTKTVYVGTASGGLWRSFTAGAGGDWQQVRLGHPALGISAIVIDPLDTNTIFIGTGEVYGYRRSNGGVAFRTMRGSYGIGILKTTDGGSAWTASLDWSYNQERGVQALKQNPRNRHTLWAATSAGLYRTANGGETWDAVLDTVLAVDIVIDPVDTARMMVSFGNLGSPGRGVYRTLDGGATWARMTGLPPYSGKTLLALAPERPDIVCASVADSTTGIGGLWRTTDFGDSWTMLTNQSTNNIFGSQGWYSHFVALHPLDSSIVVHNAVGLSRSSDGGQTFSPVATGYADNHGYAIDPLNPNVLYAANDDGIYRSADFGRSYVSIGRGMQTSQFYNGFSCSVGDSLLALGQNQDHLNANVFRGGMHWDHSAVADEVGWTAIDPVNDSIMYTVFRFGGAVLKSVNRGSSFSRVVNFSGVGCWNSPLVVSPSHPEVLYVADARVRKSTNRGATWFATNGNLVLDGNPVLSLAISARSPDTVYAGTAPRASRSRIFRTTNGGVSWTNITGSLPDRYPMDMAVDPGNAGVVYLAFGGFGAGHLYKTTDAGASWTDVGSTLPDAPATAVAVDPLHPDHVYAGNDIGVYVSTDGGIQWFAFSEGLPDAVIVADLTISPSNRVLRMATHGNGIWERSLLNDLPQDHFDYRVLTIDYPVPGSVDTVGTAFSGLRATIANLSAAAQTDSFTMALRVLRGGDEIWGALRRVPGMGFAETRQVLFPGTFVPPDTAAYTLQAFTMTADHFPANDTVAEPLLIVSPPTMHAVQAAKQYAPYQEITGGLAGPIGDDAQQRLPLPFPFLYDGFLYDSCQVSTNGWLELGAGTAGSLRGLSTEGQLGGFFLATLGTRGRPTKALGPWWTDLSTNGAVGEITSATLGSAPGRVFVVQWKNMLAYYDPGITSTYINFQVRLAEGTNVVEYCYGPVFEGVFPAGVGGASIGLKDYVGGDYRYYDLTWFGTGLTADLRADLNPLTDWPGPDSCYRITTASGPVSVEERKERVLPERFTLSQNYPNPFNPATTIEFRLPVSSAVTLTVFNAAGQEVAVLLRGGEMNAGTHHVEFNGGSLASGVYLYRLTALAGGRRYSETRKMLLLR